MSKTLHICQSMQSQNQIYGTQISHDLLHHIRDRASGPGKNYVHKILFAWTLRHLAHRLVVLDSDIIIRSRLDPLATFPVSGIGLTLEQASWYRSKIDGGHAFNGGLQIHQVEKIVNNICFNSFLYRKIRSGWTGDQSWYSQVHCPYFFTVLPCEWNRQVGSVRMDLLKKFKSRPSDVRCKGCNILHLNDNAGKRFLTTLRLTHDCDKWSKVVEHYIFSQTITECCNMFRT